MGDAMEVAGFVINPLEWWHYALPGKAGYPILDDSFCALKVVPGG